MNVLARVQAVYELSKELKITMTEASKILESVDNDVYVRIAKKDIVRWKLKALTITSTIVKETV